MSSCSDLASFSGSFEGWSSAGGGVGRGALSWMFSGEGRVCSASGTSMTTASAMDMIVYVSRHRECDCKDTSNIVSDVMRGNSLEQA